jgi:Ca-activated chloride channel family protein
MNQLDRTRLIFILFVAGAILVVIISLIIDDEPLNPSVTTEPKSLGASSSQPPDESEAPVTEPPPGSVEVIMLTADTKAEWVRKATEPFNTQGFETSAGNTIFVEVIEEGSPGDAQQAVIDETIQLVVWSPGDMSWVETANQTWQDLGKGTLVSGECPRIVFAATGFAMWRPMAEAMGWPDTPIGWDDIVTLASDPEGWGRYGHPEWGQFKFGHTHPEHSNTGFFMLANLAYSSLDATSGLTPELVKSEQVVEAFQKVELNTYHYGYSTRLLQNMMAEQGPAYLHAVTASETSALKNNEVYTAPAEKRFPFVFIFPAEGTFWSDNPFCILDTEWVSDEQREAAEIYRDFLLQSEQQDLAVNIGLRPANPDVSLHDPISLEYGTDPRVSPKTVPPLEGVSGETAEAIIDVFETAKKKATIIVVLDRSKSMAEEGKLLAAIEGTRFFLGELDREDEVQVFLFNDDVTHLQPLAPAGEVVETLLQNLKNMWAEGNTALYDAVCQAQEVIEAAKSEDEQAGEKRLYGIVVLSDGDDTNSSRTEGDMFRCLPSGEDVAGTKVFTIAYGDEANQDLLIRIANRTNGRSYTADPENISEIYKKISSEQ